MKENSIEKMTTEQLEKGIKTSKFVCGLLGGMLLTLIVLDIYNIVKGNTDFIPLMVPIALLPILFLLFGNLKKMKDELSNRKV